MGPTGQRERVTRRLRRQAPTCGPVLPAERRRACRRMWRWASAGVACAAGERPGVLGLAGLGRAWGLLGRAGKREGSGPELSLVLSLGWFGCGLRFSFLFSICYFKHHSN